MKKNTKKQAAFQPVQTEEQRKRRARRIIAAAVVLVIITAACWWAMPKNKELGDSSIFNAGEVEAKSEQIVQYINDEDYDSLKAIAVEDMASLMNKERLSEAKARVSEDWGSFRSIKDITTAEVTQRGVTAAVAYVAAEYENVEIHYTFAFDEDMKLASFGIQ